MSVFAVREVPCSSRAAQSEFRVFVLQLFPWVAAYIRTSGTETRVSLTPRLLSASARPLVPLLHFPSSTPLSRLILSALSSHSSLLISLSHFFLSTLSSRSLTPHFPFLSHSLHTFLTFFYSTLPLVPFQPFAHSQSTLHTSPFVWHAIPPCFPRPFTLLLPHITLPCVPILCFFLTSLFLVCSFCASSPPSSFTHTVLTRPHPSRRVRPVGAVGVVVCRTPQHDAVREHARGRYRHRRTLPDVVWASQRQRV